MFLSIDCNNINTLKIFLLLKLLLVTLFVIVPIIYSIVLYIKGIKNKRKSKKKDNYIKRVKYSLLVILLFVIIYVIFYIVTFNMDNDFLSCLNSSNIEYIKELKLFESNNILDEQKVLKNNLDSDNYISGIYDDDTPIKVLMVGNSLTYMNGYGQILTRMAKATGKKIIVVNAVRGGSAGQARNLVRNKLQYKCWSANTSDCSNQTGHAKLSKVIDIDFAHQGRRSWDYVIVQNYIPSKGRHRYSTSKRLSILRSSDMAIYNTVKDNLTSRKGFIINLNRQSKFRKYHVNVLSKIGGSLVDTWHILTRYPNYKDTLLLHDNARHQKVNGAYLYACVIYSKIYGKAELASSINSSNFLSVYGDASLSSFHPKPKKGRKGVSLETAKRIQALVYKYYDEYVLYY